VFPYMCRSSISILARGRGPTTTSEPKRRSYGTEMDSLEIHPQLGGSSHHSVGRLS
jgi:hypothetical protein